jgi:hypothetical protein
MITLHWIWLVAIAVASGSATFLFALILLSRAADRLGEDHDE